MIGAFYGVQGSGTSRPHTDDAATYEVAYDPRETRHFTFGSGGHLRHALEKAGTHLWSATVSACVLRPVPSLRCRALRKAASTRSAKVCSMAANQRLSLA
ncbi:hypothetical protein ACFXB3_16415 [Streptomyces sp. NPDC059447]|uniref:hypothetical protein n=1 Tax=Streptomyces TaxID=1883 RepID=UPI0016760068|nr:hypothetical protein [Streptomyces nojiriensis]